MMPCPVPLRLDLEVITGAHNVFASLQLLDAAEVARDVSGRTFEWVFKRHRKSPTTLLVASESVEIRTLGIIAFHLTESQSADLQDTTGVYDLAMDGEIVLTGSYTTRRSLS